MVVVISYNLYDITHIYFLNCEKIALGLTAESNYHICDKDGTYSSVTEIGVATNFDQLSADYYSYKVICDCVQETDSYSGGTYTHDSFIWMCS